MSWLIGAAIGFLLGGLIGAVIGAVIVGGIVGFIRAVIRGFREGLTGDDNEEEAAEEKHKKLKLKIKRSALELEDGTRGNFFVLHVKGDIIVPTNDYKVKTIVEIFDTTDAVEKLVYTNEEAYNDRKDGTFCIEGENIIPYEATSLDTDVEQIMIDSLILPRKGERKLFFKYTIIDSLTGKNIKVLSTQKIYYYNIAGYQDIQENTPLIEELSIQMAFYMSSIDGNIDTKEGKVVSAFGEKILEVDYTDEQEENKKRINGYISSAYKAAKNKQLNIQELMNKVNEICTIDIKYIIFDTCLDVAAADGVADKDELELAYYMAQKLELDKNEYMKMIEKKLPINIQNEEDLAHTFEKNIGITPGMSSQEIGEILKKEFKKWNQRVAHTDSNKREQAELMLHKISELRRKYKN